MKGFLLVVTLLPWLTGFACPEGRLHPGRLVRVVDADTVDARLDLDFGLELAARLRLVGIDAPERRDPNPDRRAKAEEATRFTEGVLSRAPGFMFCYRKDDSFGRRLGEVVLPTGAVLGEELVARGLARRWKP